MRAEDLRAHIKAFRFREALAGVGWNAPKLQPFERQVGGVTYRFLPIAEQGGIFAFEVTTQEDHPEPDNARRKSIDAAISAEFNRNLLIFVNPNRTSAHIQGVVYRDGKRIPRGIPFQLGRPIEPVIRLFQALDIPYELFDEQGQVAPTAAIAIVEKPFLADKVTKKFFREFSDKRQAFVRFLDWIEDESRREWYCSVLLNRLMFIYFIAERGFLPHGREYLTKKLAENAKENGRDTFYTHFLLPLSFYGLGKPKSERGRFESTFEGVIYLDGGLFATHSVERDLGITAEGVEAGTLPPEARIPDAEFQKWFDYFNAWRWTLDDEKYENDISPHILGYIFEKYVNQKQMGAYYTKEDITGYICRNTIIPRLFDMLAETGEKGSRAVEPLPIGPHPNLLNNGLGVSQGEGIDRYIYPAVKQTEFLPTETEYEFKQRQKRYESILQDFDDGKIAQINDFITYNLDIEKLAQDFVATIQDPEVLWAFWDRCLTKITVLDPTCGSGAFLFAALKILFPLYAEALRRMRAFLVSVGKEGVPDLDFKQDYKPGPEVDLPSASLADPSYKSDRSYSEVLTNFEATLREVTKDHPHADYFIKKKIIVQNLYGVDIMEEAVEICKLRLFLELMRTVEKDDSKDNFGVEPLPDIDFNILAGNTLVGYTSIEDIDRLWALVGTSEGVRIGSLLATVQDHDALRLSLNEYGRMLGYFRRTQLRETGFPSVNKELVTRTGQMLRDELDENLFELYARLGLVTGSEKIARRIDPRFKRWKVSHQPFHWLVEFPAIEAEGGYDVIIGNPPYVEVPKIPIAYTLLPTLSLECGNLYVFVAERSLKLSKPSGRVSMIVPVSMLCTDRMVPLQRQLLDRTAWFSSFDIRPSCLFSGVAQRLTIFSSTHSDGSAQWYLGGYRRWFDSERESLFERLRFVGVSPESTELGFISKFDDPTERAISDKANRQRLHSLETERGATLFVHRIVRYFIKAVDFEPHFWNEREGLKRSEDYKPFVVRSEASDLALAVLNSSVAYWLWHRHSDGFHCGYRDIRRIGIGRSSEPDGHLGALARKLMDRLRQTAIRKSVVSRSAGKLEFDEFRVTLARPIIDEIDRVLAKHYGFTDEELEFIINYDLKYRMGRDAAVGEGED